MSPNRSTVWTAALLASTCLASAAETGDPRVAVDVRRFSRLTKDGDWSPAIQAAIDYVSKANGFDAGGTVLLPAGTYRIDQSIVLGGNPAHWGLRLLGYGATLVGTPQLNEQSPYDPEPEAKDKGAPMLVLKSPPGGEGSGYCVRRTAPSPPRGQD